MMRQINKRIVPSALMAETRVPDVTPGVIAKYALNDEQVLLAKLRYNRVIDIFTGMTCYSLQSHLRATIPKMGHVEMDEIYLGLNSRGEHYIFPIHAIKVGAKLMFEQIKRDFAICAASFPSFNCRVIAAQFMKDDIIVLFDVSKTKNSIAIYAEKHYRLVSPQEMI